MDEEHELKKKNFHTGILLCILFYIILLLITKNTTNFVNQAKQEYLCN